jgi:hypothetical protein
MDSTLLALKLLPLALICSIGPGLLVVGRLRWSPMEKLCAVFSTSFVAVYLASFALFCLNAPVWAYWTTSAIFLVAGLAGWRTARLLVRRRTRRVLLAWLAVLAWDFLHLAMVRHYGGGGWSGDWTEHYQRTRYFIHQLPNDYLFLGRQSVPARPPMMNLIAAFFCRQVGLSFQVFSLIFLFLNAWAFLPCCLLMTGLSRRGARMIPVLAVLFMLTPSIVEGATLTVTKAFAAGLVILGVSYYLRRRAMAAAIVLSAAVLAHYSAVPFALAVGLHCFFTRFGHRALKSAAAAGALLATWFVWSIWVFGPRQTIWAGVLTTGAERWSTESNFRRMLYNMFTSIVPHPLHRVANDAFDHLSNWGQINDYYFSMTQQTLPMMAGLVGGVVAVGLLVKRLLVAHPVMKGARGFWIFYLAFTFIVGICVNADWNDYGCAHITLQSLALMAVTLLAANLIELPAWLLGLVLVGAAVDYALGILLQFDRESYIYPTAVNGAGQSVMLPDYTLGRYGASDYLAKLRAGYVFWGDRFAGAAPVLEMASVAIAVYALWFLLRLYVRKSSWRTAC